ncbi:MAG: hypothetical protein ACE5GW_06695, partial [Planctomycetota bacterium]
MRAAFPSLLNLGAALMVILALEESLVHPGPWHIPLALAGAGIVEALLRGVGRWRALEWAPAFAGALLLGLLAALLGLSAGWTQVIFLGAGVGLGLLGRRARLPSLSALGAAILLFALLWILALS